jgi:hypothetical protein
VLRTHDEADSGYVCREMKRVVIYEANREVDAAAHPYEIGLMACRLLGASFRDGERGPLRGLSDFVRMRVLRDPLGHNVVATSA